MRTPARRRTTGVGNRSPSPTRPETTPTQRRSYPAAGSELGFEPRCTRLVTRRRCGLIGPPGSPKRVEGGARERGELPDAVFVFRGEVASS